MCGPVTRPITFAWIPKCPSVSTSVAATCSCPAPLYLLAELSERLDERRRHLLLPRGVRPRRLAGRTRQEPGARGVPHEARIVGDAPPVGALRRPVVGIRPPARRRRGGLGRGFVVRFDLGFIRIDGVDLV